jgi:hypothetical protein
VEDLGLRPARQKGLQCGQVVEGSTQALSSSPGFANVTPVSPEVSFAVQTPQSKAWDSVASFLWGGVAHEQRPQGRRTIVPRVPATCSWPP